MLDISQFTFISDGCHSTFLNDHYNIHQSPFSTATCSYTAFRKLYRYFNQLSLTNITKVCYSNTEVAKYPTFWRWDGYNSTHHIDTKKCFAYRYAIESTNDYVEMFYRHYEDNEDNHETLKRRINRFIGEKDIIKPFFVLSKSRNPAPAAVEEDYIKTVKDLLDFDYEYKLLILPTKYKNQYTESKYILFSDKIHEPLMPDVDLHFKTYW